MIKKERIAAINWLYKGIIIICYLIGNWNEKIDKGLSVFQTFLRNSTSKWKLFLILLCILLIIIRLNLCDFIKYQILIWLLRLCMLLSIIWLITRLTETNRGQFDFAKAELKLVSRFNVEYREGCFILFFIGICKYFIYKISLRFYVRKRQYFG